MTTMKIALLGAVRELAAVELPSATSVHSGRPLRRFALELHVPDERHEELDTELQAAATVDGQHLRGTDAAWRVSEGWTAASQGRRPEIYIYRMEIQEVEVLHASALEIEGLSNLPTRYKEQVDEDTVTVTVVADVTPELVVDEGKPATAPSALALVNQPRLDRTVERVMANTDALAKLLEELHARGVLSESAFQAIAAAASPRPLTREEERELSRTDRLSDYWR